jgi:hypothetical protein
MAQTPPAASAMEGMEAPPHPAAQPASARYLRNERPTMGEFAQGILAHRRLQTPRRRDAQRLLDHTRPAGILRPLPPPLAGDAGQAAVAIESGKRKTACFRWGCNKRLRSSFSRLADTTRHWHPWAADLYAAALARGHDHPRALRTVGRAWCRIVWRCWQDGTAYDPARHRALQRHITVTIPTPSGPMPDTAATQRMLGQTVTETAARRARARSA